MTTPTRSFRFGTLFLMLCFLGALAGPVARAQSVDPIRQPYLLDTGLTSRSISFENPTGAPGQGGRAASNLGAGRKGAPIGIRNLHPEQWWGEGEIKAYLDGDREFPTICGTGSEDYVGLSWGIQQTPFLYNGCSLNQKQFVSMYRWHLPDPIAWKQEAPITIQQISYKKGLAETEDDWSCATFWYEPTPSAPLPAMPDVKARTADLWKD